MRSPSPLSAVVLVLLLGACGTPSPTPEPADPVVATFSIAAFDEQTGDLGVAVQSKFLGVGVVVPWVRADVGAVATQAFANPAYGPEGLGLLDDGMPAADVVKRLVKADEGRARRQLGVVDASGRAAAFTGKRTLAWAGHIVGKGYCCQGNILTGKPVVDAMAKAFETAQGPLAERLVAALEAGQAAGGDRRGRQSAALLVKRRGGGYLGANDRYIDLRVDDHIKPLEELARLLKLRRGFGRDAPVPEKFVNTEREPRNPVDGRAGARAVWERWQRLRRAQDWEGVFALANRDYREKHTLKELIAAETNPKLQQSIAARGAYLGTGFNKDRSLAQLFFAVPRLEQSVMVVMVREKDGWKTVP